MRRTTTLLAALAVVAAACTDSGGGGQEQTEAGAVEAVERAASSALTGDADAFLNFLSEECRDAVDDSEVRLAISLIPAFFSDLFEGEIEFDEIEVRAEIVSFDDDTARVDVAYTGPDGESVETLGFSSDTFTVMYENGKWVDSGCDFEDTSTRDAERLDEALAELGYEATRDDPVPRSVAAPIGQGFVVSVDAIDTDAADTLLAIEDAFVSEPEPGEQLVLASVTVGFIGPGEPESLNSVNGQVIGGSSGVGADDFGCGSIPTQLSNRSVQLFTGGVATGDLCFVVPSEDIDGLQLSIEAGFSDRQIIFDPTIEPSTPVPVPQSSGPAPDGEFTEARQNPTPLGEPVDLGDGWTITVRGVQADATAAVVGVNDFNRPPPPGFVYTLVDYELVYDGSEQSASGFSVDVDVVGDSNVSGDRNCNVSDIPDELDRFADVFQGGTLAGNSCFVVAEGDLDSLVVYASADFFDEEPHVIATR